jgi:hypothetical protein
MQAPVSRIVQGAGEQDHELADADRARAGRR